MKDTTLKNVTVEQINALAREAKEHGDEAQYLTCQAARRHLESGVRDSRAVGLCVQTIRAAEAMRDD